ncbi:bacteriorhodopsin-like [Candidatus Pelagibacter sp.]|nr:bacteriorhodopsin-like [Candidatus Pelagibacter sp.]
MKKLKLFALTAVALMGVSGVASAETPPLDQNDFVGISFWIVSMACLAATVFFFIERSSVPAQWRTSITVAGLVTGIAFIHYMYMRDVWIDSGESPTVFRYIDWLITVPLLMLEFYFVLAAVGKANAGVFWRLLIGTMVMLIGGYLGEAGYLGDGSGKMLGFIIGMAGWFYILYEVFSGEAGKMAAKSGNKALVTAFGAMRMIVTVGWAIYPLGYVFGHLTESADPAVLNVIYNAADFLNKIAFGLIIWAAAMTQSSGRARK